MAETILVNFCDTASSGGDMLAATANYVGDMVTQTITGLGQNISIGGWQWDYYYHYPWPSVSTTCSHAVLKANVLDSADKYTVDIDVPGIKGKDIRAEVTNRLLQVTVNFGSKNGTGDRLSGETSRIFWLPETVKSNPCSATLEDGVLSLVFSKDAKFKTHKIEVK